MWASRIEVGVREREGEGEEAMVVWSQLSVTANVSRLEDWEGSSNRCEIESLLMSSRDCRGDLRQLCICVGESFGEQSNDVVDAYRCILCRHRQQKDKNIEAGTSSLGGNARLSRWSTIHSMDTIGLSLPPKLASSSRPGRFRSLAANLETLEVLVRYRVGIDSCDPRTLLRLEYMRFVFLGW